MITVKELSEQINISKTSIYNLIKRHDIQTFKKNGVSCIDEHGMSLILAHYSVAQHETMCDIIKNEPFQADFQPDFQPVEKVENPYLTGVSEDKLDEKGKTFQADFQPDFQPVERVENTHLIRILETQLNEKDKTIQSLIQSNQALIQAVTNQQKLQATQYITDNQLTSDAVVQGQQPAKKHFFARFFKKM